MFFLPMTNVFLHFISSSKEVIPELHAGCLPQFSDLSVVWPCMFFFSSHKEDTFKGLILLCKVDEFSLNHRNRYQYIFSLLKCC